MADPPSSDADVQVTDVRALRALAQPAPRPAAGVAPGVARWLAAQPAGTPAEASELVSVLLDVVPLWQRPT